MNTFLRRCSVVGLAAAVAVVSLPALDANAGDGFAAGLAGGIIGSAIGTALTRPAYPVYVAPAPVYAAPVYVEPAPVYVAPPVYAYPDPAYRPLSQVAPVGPNVVTYGDSMAGSPEWLAYCTARFRSFDPASGTYLGYDGIRHPCVMR